MIKIKKVIWLNWNTYTADLLNTKIEELLVKYKDKNNTLATYNQDENGVKVELIFE